MKKIIFIPMVLFIFISPSFPESSFGQGRGWFGRGTSPMASDTLPVPKDAQEKRIMDVLEEMAGSQRGMLNVQMDDGRLLRILAETTGAKHVSGIARG